MTCVLLAAATPAAAQPDEARAEALYDRGRALMQAGKVREACAAFDESQRLDPQLTALLALATCRERLGQIATAWELFLEVERQSRSADDRKARDLSRTAAERAALLEPRLSKLTINVPATSKIDQLEILRDWVFIPSVSWNRAVPVDGGTYTITVRAPGLKEWATKVTIKPERDVQSIYIPDLRLLQREPADSPAAPRRRSLVPPVVAGSGALLLLGGALGFSLWGDSTYDDAKAEMSDQARRDELYDSANAKRLTAQVLAGAGVGCAGLAVWLYLRRSVTRTEPAPAQATRWILAPTASGIGVAGQF